MNDLIEFLEREIAADEEAARGTGPDASHTWTHRRVVNDDIVSDSENHLVAIELFPEDAGHIARHDPARVLRECAAKRQLIIEYRVATVPQEADDGRFRDGRLHAASWALFFTVQSYADRPGFRDEWKIGQT